MTKINVKLTSTIIQEKDKETFHKNAVGDLTRQDKLLRVSYLEDEQIPVKLLLKEDELIIRRGVDQQNYSLMRFKLGEKGLCHYLVNGQQMDLTSVTKLLEFEENEGSSKLHVEYDLFSGLYLIGNYAVTLIFI